MTTFKAEIAKGDKRKDGTYNVKIRITHKRKVRRYATQMYASDKDITRSGKIKNQAILDNADAIIREWRRKLLAIGDMAELMDVREILQVVTRANANERIPMFPWMRTYASHIANAKTRSIYMASINKFSAFVGEDMAFQQLRSSDIQAYLREYGQSCEYSIVRLRKMFREAMMEYNEDDVLRIPSNPFDRIKIEQRPSIRKRGLSSAIIRMVAGVPDEARSNSSRNLARDMFILSFCTMGTNFVDLYNADMPQDGVLRYERSKTRKKRADKAYIEIVLPQIALDLIYKYRGYKGKMLNLCNHYATEHGADTAISRGMTAIKQYLIDEHRKNTRSRKTDDAIAKELGIEELTFYSARHSWATIARNELNIDKWTVHEGLNHVDSATSITDVYIKKDFTRINEANRLVVEHVFGEK